MKRLVTGILSLFWLSAIVFWLIEYGPGNSRDQVRWQWETHTQVSVEKVPAPHQYFDWLRALLTQGDWGETRFGRTSIASLLLPAVMTTLPYLVSSLGIYLLLSLLLGLLLTRWPGGKNRILFPLIVITVIPTPLFIVILNQKIGPSFPIVLFAHAASHILVGVSLLFTELRAELTQPHFQYAEAKGLSKFRALWRHALPPVSVSFLASLHFWWNSFIGTSLVIETVCEIQGIGRLFYLAIRERETQLVVACLVFFCLGHLFLGWSRERWGKTVIPGWAS